MPKRVVLFFKSSKLVLFIIKQQAVDYKHIIKSYRAWSKCRKHHDKVASLVVLYTEATLVLILMNTLGTHYINLIMCPEPGFLEPGPLVKRWFPSESSRFKPNILFTVKQCLLLWKNVSKIVLKLAEPGWKYFLWPFLPVVLFQHKLPHSTGRNYFSTLEKWFCFSSPADDTFYSKSSEVSQSGFLY